MISGLLTTYFDDTFTTYLGHIFTTYMYLDIRVTTYLDHRPLIFFTGLTFTFSSAGLLPTFYLT